MATSVFKKCNIEYFDISNPIPRNDLKDSLSKRLSHIDTEKNTIVLLCIGTDRATGDCLGPLVGEKLNQPNRNYKLYGTLSAPVHALNLKDTIDHITTYYENPYIIAVDAALGNASHVGYVTLSNCPIAPGKGVNKKLPIIGDVSITGIVNVSGKKEGVLQSTRLYTVMQLANSIADALIDCLA